MIIISLFFLSMPVLINVGEYVIGSEFIFLDGIINIENYEKEKESIHKKNSKEMNKLLDENYFKDGNYRYIRPYKIEKDFLIDMFCINILEDGESKEIIKNVLSKDKDYFKDTYYLKNDKIFYTPIFAKKYCEKYESRLPKPQEIEIALNYYKIQTCSLKNVKQGHSMEYALDGNGKVVLVIYKGNPLNYKLIDIIDTNEKHINIPFRCIKEIK